MSIFKETLKINPDFQLSQKQLQNNVNVVTTMLLNCCKEYGFCYIDV